MNTQAQLPMIAGSVSTAIFIASTLPMLIKAARTKDLSSYSLANIVLANVGNGLYAVYVLSLPVGPLWALHGFHTTATALMLYWHRRWQPAGTPRSAQAADPATPAARRPATREPRTDSCRQNCR